MLFSYLDYSGLVYAFPELAHILTFILSSILGVIIWNILFWILTQNFPYIILFYWYKNQLTNNPSERKAEPIIRLPSETLALRLGATKLPVYSDHLVSVITF